VAGAANAMKRNNALMEPGPQPLRPYQKQLKHEFCTV